MIAFAEQLERMRKYHEAQGALEPSQRFGMLGIYAKSVVADKKARELTFIINTDDVDSDAEIVVPDGLDFEPFKRNDGRVFLDHKYDLQHTIGKLRRLRAFPTEDNVRGWMMTMFVSNSIQSGHADAVLLAAREIGIGASIGFIPQIVDRPRDDDPERYKSAEWIIRKASVFEVSLTMLPANLSCQGVEDEPKPRASSFLMGAAVERLVTKGKIKPETAEAMGWARPMPLPLPPMRLGV